MYILGEKYFIWGGGIQKKLRKNDILTQNAYEFRRSST